jgi:hypothetical protein
MGILRELKTKAADDVRRAQASSSVPLPGQLNRLAVLHDEPNRPAAFFRQGGGDNSNTQFAILGLWAARGHDLPLDRTLALIVRHFRSSQNPDGSWNYNAGMRSANAQGNPTMTCAGLLGLAVGLGLAAEKHTGARPADDPDIQRALQVVAGRIDSPLPERNAKGKRPAAVNRGVPDMYFLWSVERVAVLYQLKTLGGKHWYHWGMDQILARQQKDGGWHVGGGHGASRTINTCFAMLFLKRVNLAKDLTDKIVTALAAAAPAPGPARKQ